MSKLVYLGLGLLVGGLAVGTVQTDALDALKSNSLSNTVSPSDSSSRISLCDNKELLKNDIEENTRIVKKDDIRLSTYEPGFEHWSQSDLNVPMFTCKKGSSEGQNVNYHYCEPLMGDPLNLEYERTNAKGEIVQKASMTIDKIVLNQSADIVELSCSFSN